jgi:hypothetical protein
MLLGTQKKEDLFKKAGFTDYKGFLDDLSYVAQNLVDELRFNEFKRKLESIDSICIKDENSLLVKFGSPPEMKIDIDMGGFDNQPFKDLVKKLNADKVSCTVIAPDKIEVNPGSFSLRTGKLTVGSTTSANADFLKESSTRPQTWQSNEDFLNNYYNDSVYFLANKGIKLDFLNFYTSIFCQLLINDIKRNIQLLNIVSNKIHIKDNKYNYYLLKNIINIQFQTLDDCDPNLPPFLPPQIPDDVPPPNPPKGKKCLVIQLKQPIKQVFFELMNGLLTTLGYNRNPPHLRTLELEREFTGGLPELYKGNPYTKLSNGIRYGQTNNYRDASLDAHIGFAQYYMEKIKDVANFFGIDINDPQLMEKIMGKIEVPIGTKNPYNITSYRRVSVKIDC